MKRADLVTSIILVPIDYVMLVSAGLTSYLLRYHELVTQIRPVFFNYPITDFLPILLSICLVGIIIFSLSGMYRVQTGLKTTELFSKVFLGISTLLLFVIIMFFLQRELFSSRFIIILAWIIGVCYVFIARYIVNRMKIYLFKRGVGLHQLILIGDENAMKDIKHYFERNTRLGYKIVATFDSYTHEVRQKIDSLRKSEVVDEIMDLRSSEDQKASDDLIYYCFESNISYRLLVTLFQAHASNFEMDTVAGYPIIQVNRTPLDGWKRVYKRLFDIVVSATLLIVSLPLFLIVGLLIKIDSVGPIFVYLNRIGRGGKVFKIIKFRSMINNAHDLKATMRTLNERADGPLFKIDRDPRITKIGRFLRKTSIDELPQLLNVLIGTMSLIGPRPHEPEEVEQYQREYRVLIGSKPGITGLAQVSGRSRLAFSEEAALDIYYIETWSPWLDMLILLKTLFVIFKFKDAA